MSGEVGYTSYRQRSGASAYTVGRSRRPRLLVASLVVGAPGWLSWLFQGRHGVVSPIVSALILLAGAALTWLHPALKGRAVRLVQKHVLNPPIRILLLLGVLPVGYVLVETVGRTSGKARRTPVANGLVGDTFWIVAEHGYSANYVRNLEADPRVRVLVRDRWRPVWREGLAHVLEADDPHARQRELSRRHPLRALNAAFVRVMGSELLTVRIDLCPRQTGRPTSSGGRKPTGRVDPHRGHRCAPRLAEQLGGGPQE